MDQRELEAFVAVAEELHFGRAAERLHVSPSPLSQTIRRLEKELDVPLFERTTRSVALTSHGRAFLPHAQRVLTQMEDSRAAARQAMPGTYGSVTLAFAGALNHRTLALLASAVRRRYPDITLHLTGGHLTAGALQQVRRGSADIAFVGTPLTAEGMTVLELHGDTLGLVLPSEHPLAQDAAPVALRELQDEPFLMASRNSGSSLRESSLQACLQAGFRPWIAQEVDDTQVMLALCAAGVGVALQPLVLAEVLPFGVVHRPLTETVSVGSGLAWAPDQLSPAASTVTELARELFVGDCAASRHTAR